MKHTIKKSALVVFLMMLWSLLAGCAYQTYEELEEEYSTTGDRTKLEQREAILLKAKEFYVTKAWCLQADKYVWMCSRVYSGSRINRNVGENRTIDGTIRQYRLERSNGCGCMDQMAIRDFMRQLERQGF